MTAVATKIKSSSDLRQFLLGAMEEVVGGKLSVERASIAVKASAQVNESIYAELKAKTVAKAMGEKIHAFGSMPLTE